MRIKGLSDSQIENTLQPFMEEDRSFLDGTIMGSMCSMPHPAALDWFNRSLEKNTGDPGLVPGTIKLEKQVLDQTAELLGGKEAAGYLVSGGTEANVLAIWTAKKRARPDQNELIVPQSAHFSFDKAADLMGLKLTRIPLDERHKVRPELVEKAINEKTFALLGIAGTTGLGAIDPIEKLSDIALKHKIYLHIDAAFGGFVIPFLKEAGKKSPPFDFSLPGVSSITLDPHKMGRSVIPGGIILYKNKELATTIQTTASYLSGGGTWQGTITGTKPGAAAVATWAVINKLGRSGYQDIVSDAIAKTNYFYNKIKQLGDIKTVVVPEMNVLGLYSKKLSPKQLAERLRAMGWAVSLFPDFVRMVMMPHVSLQMIDHVIKDLESLSKENQ